MSTSVKFDEKEFWIQLFPIVARRETADESRSFGLRLVLESMFKREEYAAPTSGDVAVERFPLGDLAGSGQC